MPAWPRDELRRIAATDDLHIAPFRDDGATYGTLTWIWSVVVDDKPLQRKEIAAVSGGRSTKEPVASEPPGSPVRSASPPLLPL